MSKSAQTPFSYKCGAKDLSVTYYNAGDISLAKLELEDETVVASNVISGSGAKYAGSVYIWWTKGKPRPFITSSIIPRRISL